MKKGERKKVAWNRQPNTQAEPGYVRMIYLHSSKNVSTPTDSAAKENKPILHLISSQFHVEQEHQ